VAYQIIASVLDTAPQLKKLYLDRENERRAPGWKALFRQTVFDKAGTHWDTAIIR
jgi:hypothetical protein